MVRFHPLGTSAVDETTQYTLNGADRARADSIAQLGYAFGHWDPQPGTLYSWRIRLHQACRFLRDKPLDLKLTLHKRKTFSTVSLED